TGMCSAEQGSVNLEAPRGLMPPPDPTYPWNETHPIRSKNENENGGKEPKRPLDQMLANDSLQKSVQALHQPSPEILYPFRHWLHVPRSKLRKSDQAQRRHPGNDHGVGDRQPEEADDLHGFLREACFLRLSPSWSTR